MLVFSALDVMQSVTMRQMIDAVRDSYVEYSVGKSVVPLRISITVANGGMTHCMPGYSPAAQAVAIKIVSFFPTNLEVGLPGVSALVLLFDADTGTPLALMEGGALTALRTGAASGVATELLALENARVGAIIGIGGQAESQLRAITEVRPLKEVRLYDADMARAFEFVRRVQPKTKARLTVTASADEAVEGADVVVTVTSSHSPVFSAGALKPGAHVNGVGSFTPAMQEVGMDSIDRMGLITVDSREATLAEAGDLITPIKKGRLDPRGLVEIGEVAASTKPGRGSKDEITFFKTVGIAALDVAAAKLVYEQASSKGLGVELSLT